MADKKVHIIGAGLSGLVCAFELEKAGFAPVILEKDDRPGGRVKTDIIDGVPLDHGFQVLLTAYPSANRYLDMDMLKLRHFLPGSMIWSDGRFTAFGDFLRNSSFLLPTLLSRVGTWKDKFGVFKLSQHVKSLSVEEIFSGEQASTSAMLNRLHFSDRIVKSFFEPFFGGIFLEKDLRTSSAMFKFIFKMFESGYAAIPASGMQGIAEQLVSRLRSTVILHNHEVEKIDGRQIFLADGSSVGSDCIVLAAPANANLKFPTDPISWKSCNTFYFKTALPLFSKPIIGLLPGDDTTINSVHSVTDLLGISPGYNVVSATVVSADELDATSLLTRVKQELISYCGLHDLELIRSYSVKYALPDLPKVKYAPLPGDTRLAEGIYRTGDVLSNGSLNGAMESGRVTAGTIIEDMGRS